MLRARRCMSASLLGVRFVIDVFLPELVLQLRIRFGLGGLAQAARDDVVVVTGGDLPRRHAAAAGGSGASGPGSTRNGAGAIASACAAPSAFGAQVAGPVARQCVVGPVAAVAIHGVFSVGARAAACRPCIALLRGLGLLALQLCVELLDRGRETAIDLGALLGGRACRCLGLRRAGTAGAGRALVGRTTRTGPRIRG